MLAVYTVIDEIFYFKICSIELTTDQVEPLVPSLRTDEVVSWDSAKSSNLKSDSTYIFYSLLCHSLGGCLWVAFNISGPCFLIGNDRGLCQIHSTGIYWAINMCHVSVRQKRKMKSSLCLQGAESLIGETPVKTNVWNKEVFNTHKNLYKVHDGGHQNRSGQSYLGLDRKKLTTTLQRRCLNWVWIFSSWTGNERCKSTGL